VSTWILSPKVKKSGTEFEHSSLSSEEVINPYPTNVENRVSS